MNDTSTRRILLLDPQTVNQIAAGEVVERPASVVKELVENSIDAEATRIEIELKDSGSSLILVRDNGIGMSSEDLVACLDRHATSKIRRLEDLFQVQSLGFRGEAIPSIASVSHFTISSGTEDGVRHRIQVSGSKRGEVETHSGSRGTEIKVEELFFNTPARLKFLKSASTELGNCVDMVQKLAAAHPEIAISLRHADSLIFQTSGDGSLFNALTELWSRDMTRALTEIDYYESGVRVRGYISPPHITKSNRNYQWIYVNRRNVRNRALMMGIEIAYRAFTPEKRFPMAVISLDIDPAKVDSNVSPSKSEVKFQQESVVVDALRHAIKHAFLQHGIVPDAGALARANNALQSIDEQRQFQQMTQLMVQAQSPLFAAGQIELPESRSYDSLLDGLRIIGQSMNTFIIAENNQGLLIVDQHVAHERVLYEKLIRERGRVSVERQTLLAPEVIEFERSLNQMAREHLEELAQLGFDLEEFGDQTYLLRAVPAALKRNDPVATLTEILDEMVNGAVSGCIQSARENIWITCSCKMAVKSGDPLSHAEMEKLMIDLAETENPYLCPHGRPITIVMQKGELFRKFKR